MENQNLEQRIERQIAKQKVKFKKLIIRHKDDFLTTLEKSWRDALLKPVTTILYKIGITANHITFLGLGIVFMSVGSYFLKADLYEQMIFLILGGLTDFVDGPLARNHNNVTILGTWMDHIRDLLLVVWASYLIYGYGLLSLEVILIIGALQIALGWFTLKDFLVKYLKGLPADAEEFDLRDFTLGNLQATVFGRAQFFFWIAGYVALFASLIYASAFLATLGAAFIILEIILAALGVLDLYKKIL